MFSNILSDKKSTVSKFLQPLNVSLPMYFILDEIVMPIKVSHS